MRTDLEGLGHERVGSGRRAVILLNDWFSDTSTWDGARAYLDDEAFSWFFTDLRGYGRSRGRSGAFTVLEAASDVLALADVLALPRFAIVGHSMSTLVALHLAQHHGDRVACAVLVTPPPPTSFGADDSALDGARALARGDDALRAKVVKERSAGRLSKRWAELKASRWGETADREAAAGYAAMFMRDGLPDRGARVSNPVLAITGELDAPPMRKEAVRKNLSHLCETLEVVALAESGHYPMQEMPPLTAALLERFLLEHLPV